MNDPCPWMMAIQMQFAAMRNIRDRENTSSEYHSVRDGTLAILKEAEAYAWTADTVNAVAFAARSIPRDVCLTHDALPGRRGWWWFGAVPAGDLPFNALLWAADNPDGVMFVLFRLDMNDIGQLFPAKARLPVDFPAWNPERFIVDGGVFRPRPYMIFVWPYAQPLSLALDEIKRDETHDAKRPAGATMAASCDLAMRLLVGGSAWLRQRVVTVSTGHVERHRRKQFAREHDAPLPADVKVIQLRRTESSARERTSGEAVEWSCRWVVNGHWRNQPYREARKLIYINPFVKGPNDKPLRVPTHTVYEVSR